MTMDKDGNNHLNSKSQ